MFLHHENKNILLLLKHIFSEIQALSFRENEMSSSTDELQQHSDPIEKLCPLTIEY